MALSDFSNANYLNIEDIAEAIDRLVDPIKDAQLRLTEEEKKMIASAVSPFVWDKVNFPIVWFTTIF